MLRHETAHCFTLLLAAAGAAGAAGCSLTSLDEFELPVCETDEDCQVLNRLEDDLTQTQQMTCRRFFCDTQSGRCGRHSDEVCDGFDNDCDEKIDETTEDGEQTIEPDGARVVENLDGAWEVTFGVGPDGQPAAAWTRATRSNPTRRDVRRAQFALFGGQGSAVTGGAPLGYRTNASEENLRDLSLVEGCSGHADTSTGTTIGSCQFNDLAFALTSAEGLFLTVNPSGCSAGQLRAGHLLREEGAAPFIVMRGPSRRSTTYLGIDSARSVPRCTGRSREGCGELYDMLATLEDPPNTGEACTTTEECGHSGLECLDETPDDETETLVCVYVERKQIEDQIRVDCGASRPSIAILGGRTSARVRQALGAWIGGTRPACGGEPAPVEVLGLYLHRGERDGVFRWVDATGEGQPHVLGQTAGGGRPAVRGWGDRGYLVGYGDAEGDLALHFVPSAPVPPDWSGYRPAESSCCTEALCGAAEPPPECSTECDGASLCCPRELDCSFGYRGDIATEPLEGILEVSSFSAGFGGPVDDVALALGAEREGRLEVGLAWREACGTGEELVAFRRVVLDADSMEVVEEGAPIRLAHEARVVGPPAIAYRREGFVEVGLERAGKTATEDTRGGWVVVWRDAAEEARPGRMVGTRVAELDGEPVDARERIDVTQSLGSSADAFDPFLYEDSDGELRYAYRDGSNDAVVGGALGCATP